MAELRDAWDVVEYVPLRRPCDNPHNLWLKNRTVGKVHKAQTGSHDKPITNSVSTGSKLVVVAPVNKVVPESPKDLKSLIARCEAKGIISPNVPKPIHISATADPHYKRDWYRKHIHMTPERIAQIESGARQTHEEHKAKQRECMARLRARKKGQAV